MTAMQRNVELIRNNMRRLMIMLTAMMLTVALHAQSFESATEAVSHFGVGWNLGNTLDANNGQACPDPVQSETMWGQPVTSADLMTMMRRAGFGAIRVPVTWYPHMDADGKVDAAWMKRVREVVDYVIDNDMYCLLNVHHDTGNDDGHWLAASMQTYRNTRARYESLWRQIAEEFRDYGERLLFEGYNEMTDKYQSWCFASFGSSATYVAADAADAYEAINSYAQSFVDVVRATGGNNAERNLVVNTYAACCGSGTWSSHLKDPLKEMKLPQDKTEGHLAFQVHSYPNVKNISSVKSEVDDMMSALKTHLQSKGAPVIIGEWGTANDGEDDYRVRRENVLAFADYFVKRANDYGIATFWWMGLSDGMARTLPAISQPDLARTILQAYHGSDYQPVMPTTDDFDIWYTVNYTGQWQELNLVSSTISLNDYKAVKVEFDEKPLSGYLSVKVYGANGKEQYVGVPQQLSYTVTFNRTTLGSSVQRVTLQYGKTGSYSIGVRRVCLIKSDGTEEDMAVSPFWGCTVESHATPKPAGLADVMTDRPASADAIYSLSGQRVLQPMRGIYIRNGRKYIK